MENNSLYCELQEAKSNLNNLREMAKYFSRISLEKWADPVKEREFLQSTTEIANSIGKAEYTLIFTKEKLFKEIKTEGLVHELINKISYSFIGVESELLSLDRFCGKSRVKKILKLFNKIINKFFKEDLRYYSENLFWDLHYLEEKIGDFYYVEKSMSYSFIYKIIAMLIELYLEKQKEDNNEISEIKLEILDEAVIFLGSTPSDLALKVAILELMGWETDIAKRIVVDLI